MNVQTSVGKLVATCTVVASLYLGTAWGQATNSADVTGSVTDSTGAVVPGVTVIVRDLDKNVERTYVTNEFGLYDTGPLVPSDHYLMIFKLADHRLNLPNDPARYSGGLAPDGGNPGLAVVPDLSARHARQRGQQ
jgi:hypothetical protein